MRLRTLLPVAVCFVVAASAQPASAMTGASSSFVAVRTEKPPALDASLSDAAWKNAIGAGDLEVITTQKPSSRPSRFLLLYDDTNLYVGMHLEQPGVPVTASQGANGVGFGLDDFAGIGVDPSANAGQVYFFMTTPRGTRYQQASESARYAPPWTAVATQTASGWSAMMVIPLSVLRTPSTAVQSWRFNFIRRCAAANENESWAYDPVMTDGGGGTNSFPQFADARFWPHLTELHVRPQVAKRRPPRAELYALTSVGDERRRFQDALGNFNATGARNMGADVVVPVTGTASFVGALAPDFSNVEIDQQTIAPQEFRRALSEYRPFFSQGANFFDPVSLNGINAPPNRIWYSPAIGPFDRGLKFEGTQGLQSFGVLEARGNGFDDDVFAIKHATPTRSFLWSFDGVLAHHAAGNDTQDPRAGVDQTWEGQIAGRNNYTGLLWSLDYAHEHGTFVPDDRLAYKSEDFVDVHKRNYEVYTGYRTVGPEYSPLLGYTQNADLRGPQIFVDVNGTLSPNGPIKRIELFLEADRATDGSGAVHQADANASVDLQLKNGLHLNGGPFVSELRTYDSGLVGYPYYAGGVTRSYNQHAFTAGWKDGTPAPTDATYSWGPFGDVYLQQIDLTAQRALGARWSVAGEIAGTRERARTGTADGQWLRRLTLGESIDANTNFSISLRSISGNGGFAVPGVNLAGSFHHRFKNDGELFLNYGTPAAYSTLQRVILKYVLRTGGGAGT
ncbi:MAG: hypothetical protein JWN27_3640 [Candidatus Eremiobacteraeota bacterium]|nr:hypothetical protein [Candidatus Eremiobacteraeota bacterium]